MGGGGDHTVGSEVWRGGVEPEGAGWSADPCGCDGEEEQLSGGTAQEEGELALMMEHETRVIFQSSDSNLQIKIERKSESIFNVVFRISDDGKFLEHTLSTWGCWNGSIDSDLQKVADTIRVIQFESMLNWTKQVMSTKKDKDSK